MNANMRDYTLDVEARLEKAHQAIGGGLNMLESGVKLGVSSRGSGNVDDMNGKVSDFEIVTVDIVAQPSAPNAYPKAIYEGMMNLRHGHRMLDIAKDAQGNKKVEKYLKEEVMRLIKDLKIK